MRHIVADVPDVPPAAPLIERRQRPDRRAVWRGGRRDSDWVNRPLSGLSRLEARQPGRFQRVLSVLHLW